MIQTVTLHVLAWLVLYLIGANLTHDISRYMVERGADLMEKDGHSYDDIRRMTDAHEDALTFICMTWPYQIVAFLWRWAGLTTKV